MIRYFDASALAKRYVEEEGSNLVQALLGNSLLASSRLSEVEVSSALARRWREGRFTREGLDRALASLRKDLASFAVVELHPSVVSLALDLLLRHALRAGDAIQLASCLLLKSEGIEVEFLAFDIRLNAAAKDEGLTVVYDPATPVP